MQSFRSSHPHVLAANTTLLFFSLLSLSCNAVASGRSRGFIGWPVTRLMRHFGYESNIALITSRLTKGETFAHVQVTDKPSEVICMSSKTSNNGFVFPLWLIEDGEERIGDMFNVPIRPNINPAFSEALANAIGSKVVGPFDLPKSVEPEEIFGYVFAVLHSPEYRARYEEYLRSDFPKIPLPPNAKIFKVLSALGLDLAQVWLMRRTPSVTGAAFNISGSNKVADIRYVPPNGGQNGRIYINEHQYFENVSAPVWQFHVGGYQVLEKWLKSRKKKVLSFDEVKHLQGVTRVIASVIQSMGKIDKIVKTALLPIR